MTDAAHVVVFGRDLCADTVRSRALLDARGILHRYIDVASDEAARKEAVRLSGRMNLPVIVLGGGAVLVEPSDDELSDALATDREV